MDKRLDEPLTNCRNQKNFDWTRAFGHDGRDLHGWPLTRPTCAGNTWRLHSFVGGRAGGAGVTGACAGKRYHSEDCEHTDRRGTKASSAASATQKELKGQQPLSHVVEVCCSTPFSLVEAMQQRELSSAPLSRAEETGSNDEQAHVGELAEKRSQKAWFSPSVVPGPILASAGFAQRNSPRSSLRARRIFKQLFVVDMFEVEYPNGKVIRMDAARMLAPNSCFLDGAFGSASDREDFRWSLLLRQTGWNSIHSFSS